MPTILPASLKDKVNYKDAATSPWLNRKVMFTDENVKTIHFYGNGATIGDTEPMFVSEISNELNIGQKAIIEHLRAMENIGILSSSYKKILRGRPRKYYDLDHEVNIHITINKNTFNVNFNEDMLNTPQLPSGDEWSKLLDIEKRIDNGQTEAISELMNQIRLYENLKNRAEYILERTLKNK